MEMKTLGETYFNNSAHYLVDGSELCYTVPQEDVLNGSSVVFTNYLPGVSPVCEFDEANAGLAVFNVLNSFHFSRNSGQSMGPILSLLFVLTCVICYITCAGGASLILDKLASNGQKSNHVLRRIFWLIASAALATTVMSTSANGGLNALQSAIVICALPVAVMLFYVLQSIFLFCRALDTQSGCKQYEFPDQPVFEMPVYGGVFNAMEYVVSLGHVSAARVELGMHKPSHFHLVEFSKGLLIPFVSLHQVLAAAYPTNKRTNLFVVCSYALCYCTWVLLWLLSFTSYGEIGVTWTIFAITGCILATVRAGIRTHYNLRSNVIADLSASIFMWPQVLTQMRLHCETRPNQLFEETKDDGEKVKRTQLCKEMKDDGENLSEI
jgi:BCCT, betaine/carnitine/choline family transporter